MGTVPGNEEYEPMRYTYAQQKQHGSKRTSAEPLSGGEKKASLPNSAMMENLGHQVGCVW